MRADIIVDENGDFLENVNGGLEANVYDADKPYGPYNCTLCNEECNLDED